MKKVKTATREKPIPESKKILVKEFTQKMTHSSVLLASTKGLPASQFQAIKKKLRGTAEVYVPKKSLLIRAIDASDKKNLKELKSSLQPDIAVMFSKIDSFELASMLIDLSSPTKARAGDIALEDINVEPGPTELIPGPAISELSGVGLKVSVEGGKLAIKLPATLAKKGEPISDKVANVLGKLKIMPMKVGFIPVAAYDAHTDTLYKEISIDKKGTLEELRTSIAKSLNFAVKINYLTKETISYFIRKAGLEEMALAKATETKSSTETQPAGESA